MEAMDLTIEEVATTFYNWNEKEDKIIVKCMEKYIGLIESPWGGICYAFAYKCIVWRQICKLLHTNGFKRHVYEIQDRWEYLKHFSLVQIREYYEQKEKTERPSALMFEVRSICYEQIFFMLSCYNPEKFTVAQRKLFDRLGGSWYLQFNRFEERGTQTQNEDKRTEVEKKFTSTVSQTTITESSFFKGSEILQQLLQFRQNPQLPNIAMPPLAPPMAQDLRVTTASQIIHSDMPRPPRPSRPTDLPQFSMPFQLPAIPLPIEPSTTIQPNAIFDPRFNSSNIPTNRETIIDTSEKQFKDLKAFECKLKGCIICTKHIRTEPNLNTAMMQFMPRPIEAIQNLVQKAMCQALMAQPNFPVAYGWQQPMPVAADAPGPTRRRGAGRPRGSRGRK